MFKIGVCALMFIAAFLIFIFSGLIADNTRASESPVWEKICTVKKSNKPDEYRLVTRCGKLEQDQIVDRQAFQMIPNSMSITTRCKAFKKEWPASDLDVVCE